MNLRDVLSTGSAFGVARVVLVAAALVGFLAMHGFAITDGVGSHHAVAVASHNPVPTVLTHSGPASPADVTPDVTSTGSEDRPLHESVMAGCLFVLLALTSGLLLRLLWTTGSLAALRGSVRRLARPAPARAPPCPVFLSLCVFRL
ncbi:MAG: hypothetical protein AVDCRST_MAG66-4750 [uncultured Pseudonocardia sp.]|uniref:Uncharacterized protein n=1 Tax=uncultured Pseudonocardia sp. TaxID=211455 RepID=A0A6J4QTY1_9PSEU|nr:MAG: hypothetical protein AVDCRST_MAG66-4750 [uncultured Pseudonocardia sp.]